MVKQRKPICIVGDAAHTTTATFNLWTLCNDGTIWQLQLGEMDWEQVQDLPDGRKAVSICVNVCDGEDNCWAVCDDGTIWRRRPGVANWSKFQDVPAIETLKTGQSPFTETERPGSAA